MWETKREDKKDDKAKRGTTATPAGKGPLKKVAEVSGTTRNIKTPDDVKKKLPVASPATDDKKAKDKKFAAAAKSVVSTNSGKKGAKSEEAKDDLEEVFFLPNLRCITRSC